MIILHRVSLDTLLARLEAFADPIYPTRTWTIEQRIRLADDWALGKPIHEISRKVGHPVKSVYQERYKLRLPVRVERRAA